MQSDRFGMIFSMLEAALRTVATPTSRFESGQLRELDDFVAIEEPLEIRLEAPQHSCHEAGTIRVSKSVSITMRTPGHDEELAVGFLVGEGILRNASELDEVFACGADVGAHDGRNIVKVRLHEHARVDWPKLERHFYATSSCGVCGKSSLDALMVAGVRPIARDGFEVAASVVCALPTALRTQQSVFDQTGGLHAAGLFSGDGTLIALREDVGRHNALDKVLGSCFVRDEFPLSTRVLCLSGRASFELVQKAVVAGIPVIAAVGAPSSAAVELARAFDVTLIGFLRSERFNIYHGAWRVRLCA